MRRTAAVVALVAALAGPYSGQLSGQRPDTAKTAKESKPERARGFFTLQDAALAGGFIVGTIGLSQIDGRLAHTVQSPSLQESEPVREGATFFRWMGQPVPELLGGALYVVGRVTHRRPVAALGLHGLEALLLSSGITGTVKGLAGRARPFVHSDTVPDDFEFLRGFRAGRDYSSFPSGHTATAFSVAAASTAEAIHWVEVKEWWPGWKYVVGGTLFGGATLVGISRMYHDQHWASDVIGGAAVGTFSGFKVVKYAYRHPRNRIDRLLLPVALGQMPDGSVLLGVTIPLGSGSAGQ